MALNATLYKITLQIADLDRHYYQTHALTLARHPSETDERVMVRLLAFALYASDTLAFGKGISSEDEPTLWEKDLTGNIERWIDVGQPEERAVRKASGRAKQVVIIGYGRAAEPWWQQQQAALGRIANLTVLRLPTEATSALAGLANRTLQLQCTIQEGLLWFTTETGAVPLEPVLLLQPANTP
ncbi:MAG: YaeQ family protein [Gammaproteobacteria bacterium]|nr:YaeQ family protein [Gammaproteobacteria bacterium]